MLGAGPPKSARSLTPFRLRSSISFDWTWRSLPEVVIQESPKGLKLSFHDLSSVL